MKLYWSTRSPFARKVVIAAHELGLAERLQLVPIVVGMSAPNPDIMKLNPLSRIPTLVLDDGTVLTDSLLICEYLASLGSDGHRLFPAEPARRFDALRRHALASGLIEILVLRRNERDRKEGARSEAHLASFAAKTEAALDTIEREIANGPAGAFDIGDIALASALGYLDFRFADAPWRPGRPRLAAWYKAVSTRPSIGETQHRDG